MADTFVVTNAASLKRVLSLQRKSRVAVMARSLTGRDRSRVQERVNHLLGESGYGLGLAGVVAALAICISWNGGHWEFFEAHLVPMAGFSAMACFLAGGLGRATGLLYARWRLARLIWLTVAEMDGYWGDTRPLDGNTPLSAHEFAGQSIADSQMA